MRSGDVIFVLDVPGTCAADVFDLLAMYYPPEHIASITEHERQPEALAALMAAGHLRLARGDVDYDVCRHLRRKPVFVTMLRDPVARVVARYRQIREQPTHPLHDPVKRASLYDFVCDPAWASEVEDVQTRRLSGTAGRVTADLAPSTLLEMARVNLYECACFGVAERLADLPFLLAYSFGWPLPGPIDSWLGRVSQNPGVEISTDIHVAIRSRNALDQKLHDDACSVFETRWRQMLGELLELGVKGPL
jgi:hypothetical protein